MKRVENVPMNDVEIGPPTTLQKKSEDSEDNHQITIHNVVEVIILMPFILAIIGLFLIPTILYALPDSASQVSTEL